MRCPPALVGAERGGGAARQSCANPGAAQSTGRWHAVGLPFGGGLGPPAGSTVARAGVLLAVGTARALVVRRYWLAAAAAAATVMVLLQAQLMHPAGGLTVAERVADTVLGALSAAAQRSAAERRRAPQRTPAHSPGAEAARPWPAADGAPVAGSPRLGRVMGCQCLPRADR